MINHYSWFFLLAVIFFFTCIGTAQNNEQNISVSDSNYFEKDIVINEIINTIRFYPDIKNKCIKARQNITYSIMAVNSNQKAIIDEYFDNYTKITNYKGVSNNNVLCGHSQTEGVFHSDLQLCQYYLFLYSTNKNKELSITKEILDTKFFSHVFFCNHYPVKKMVVKFEIPDDIKIELKDFNISLFHIKKTNYYLQDEKITVYEYNADSISEYKSEENSSGYLNTYPHILVLSKAFIQKNDTFNIFSNFNDLYQWSKKMFSYATNDTLLLKPKVSEIIKGLITDKQKINAIYKWVQGNIRYIAFEEGLAGYIPENAQNVYSLRYGDCKGMSNLLKTMLGLAGFNARITWLGTNELPYNLNFPSVSAVNHVICILNLGTERFILDATNKYARLGDIPSDIQGCRAMIENGSTYIIDTIPEEGHENNLNTFNYHYVISNEDLNGKVNIDFRGVSRERICYLLENISITDQKTILAKILSSDISNVLVKNLNFSDPNKNDSILNFESDITIKGKVSVFEDELYISPESLDDFSYFKIPEKRLGDFNIGRKIYRKVYVQTAIPKGFSLKRLPDDVIISDDLIKFSIKSYKENDNIICAKELKILVTKVSKARFNDWNNDIKKIIKANGQKIILQAVR